MSTTSCQLVTFPFSEWLVGIQETGITTQTKITIQRSLVHLTSTKTFLEECRSYEFYSQFEDDDEDLTVALRAKAPPDVAANLFLMQAAISGECFYGHRTAIN